MKKTILNLLLFLPLVGLHAQTCPDGFYDLHHNRIQARFNAGGDLFTDFENGYFLPDPVAGQDNPWTIFAANLWLGGIDPGGNVQMVAPTYSMTGTASAGPADYSSGSPVAADCENWDRLFSVKGADIEAFLADIPADPATAAGLFPGIMGWPGKGNLHFEAVNGFPLTDHISGLAPFFDANGDGVYNPMDGDYPAVVVRDLDPFVAGEMVWGAFNTLDQGGSIPLEVHLTAWAFNCEGLDALNNTVFTAHKVIYHGQEILTSAYLGLWVDFDIGCYLDDYLGTSLGQHAVFAYNRDLVDGEGGTTFCPNGIPSLGENPPVQSATFLGRPMDKAIYYNSGSFIQTIPGMMDPSTPLEYYRVLTGNWRDGTPLTYGGSGYNPNNQTPVDHFSPDDPADSQGWSMCASFLPDNDRRVVVSSLVGALQPGHVDELVTAWTQHPNPNLPCDLGDTYFEIEEIRSYFNDNFDIACSPLSAVRETKEVRFGLYPNPATSEVAIDAGDMDVLEIAVFRSDGAPVFSGKAVFALDVSAWSPGLYLVKLKTHAGWITEKLAVH